MDQAQANEAAAAALGTVEIGGTVYLIEPITDQVFATLRAHLRTQLRNPIASVAEAVKDLPPAVQAAAIKEAVALHAGGGAEVTPARVNDFLFSPDGASFLAWLLARPRQPAVTLEQIRAGVTTKEDAVQLLAELYRASGLESVGNEAGRTG